MTRRQRNSQGQIRLLVDGRWIDFDPSVKFRPGDWVRYGGNTPWVTAIFGRRPVQVQRWVAGCLNLPHPTKPGEIVQTLDSDWELCEPPVSTEASQEASQPEPPPPRLKATREPFQVWFEMERWIGLPVFYEGRKFELVDVLLVSGFAQIANGGPPFLIPINKIQPVA